ncbi:MAG: hypothetical protein GY757_04670, partial [bacterium]|nr:hypothetical protein [bacterium]
KHLENPDLLVQNGSFEILCYTGDIFHDSAIFEFFEKRFNTIKCLAEPECDILYWLIMQYKQYLARYQFMIEEQIPNIIKKFRQIKDIRVQGLFIELICHGKKTNAVSFMDEIYPTEPKLQKEIIQAFSGNEIAADFLFDKYEKDENLRDVAIESLLNIPKGLSYFTEHFFGLEFETQEIVAMKLPYSRGHDLVDFIKQVFQADI